MTTTNAEDDNGFAEWGGYMAAKKAKLVEQYEQQASSSRKRSDILKGVAIYVNGYTSPSAEELKVLMAAHGGIYHTYQMPNTTHIIASILPNAKVKQLGNVPIVKATWISDSISTGTLLDYRKYLLYTNHTDRQPKLDCVTFTKPQTIKTLTAADPGFLSEFYNNSRLHLISTLGAEYKQLVNQLREKSNGLYPGRERLKTLPKGFTRAEKVIMHIDMDCFFVSVGLRSKPHLRGQPVAVTHGRGAPLNRSEVCIFLVDSENEPLDSRGSMAEVASCSYEARQCGVRNGMFLGNALKICPNLKMIPYDFEGYREVSTTLYKTIAEYTLDIEAVSCDEMYVDVLPILKSANVGVEDWATHIRKEITEITGCPCSAGFGANRLQARLANRKAKPAGQFYLKPEEVDDYMANVNLSDLPGVGSATVTKLSKMGLQKCGDLQTVTKGQIQAELGNKIGQTVVDLANGVDHKPLNFHHERKSVSADVNYGIRFKDKAEALNFLQSLSTEVYGRLKDIGMRARYAPVEPAKFLGCGACNTITRSTTSVGLINDSATVYREAKILLERCNVIPSELRGVGIQLTRLETAPPVNTAIKRFLKGDVKEPVRNESKPVISKPVTEPTGNCIDLNMLDELPEHIKVEVIKEYKLEHNAWVKHYEKDRNDPCALSLSLRGVSMVETANARSGVPKYSSVVYYKNINKLVPISVPVEEKSPFDSLTLDELRPLILKWLESTTTPNNIDTTLLANHLKKLAIDRKIEQLKVILNFLYRHISRLGSCPWHDAYWKLIDIVQEGMVARYGSTILVERNFCCPTHF
ncbi:hypothetical protein RI129_012569 [Pyrocoelia pectoralis]|uniref:DNA repair protein REV1 n=1 Tax=Pyrocoelia pectoralis TaxID=417401 RepID=A0AAN7V0N0_9COLE